MELEVVLHGVDFIRRAGPTTEVSGVEYDSRRVQPGSLFVAFRGGTTDGNRYLPQAVAQGARAIVTDSAAGFSAATAYPDLAVIEVPQGRPALAAIAANFFAHPEAQLKLSGVTGTNGKTTTAFLLEAMLRHQGRKTILAGTIEYHAAGRIFPPPTPHPNHATCWNYFAKAWTAAPPKRSWKFPPTLSTSNALPASPLTWPSSPTSLATISTTTDDGGVLCRQAQTIRELSAGRDPQCGRPLRSPVKSRISSSLVYTYGLQQGDFHANNLDMEPAGMRFTMVTLREKSHSPPGSPAKSTSTTCWLQARRPWPADSL